MLLGNHSCYELSFAQHMDHGTCIIRARDLCVPATQLLGKLLPVFAMCSQQSLKLRSGMVMTAFLWGCRGPAVQMRHLQTVA